MVVSWDYISKEVSQRSDSYETSTNAQHCTRNLGSPVSQDIWNWRVVWMGGFPDVLVDSPFILKGIYKSYLSLWKAYMCSWWGFNKFHSVPQTIQLAYWCQKWGPKSVPWTRPDVVASNQELFLLLEKGGFMVGPSCFNWLLPTLCDTSWV